jgi:hypothetical protein
MYVVTLSPAAVSNERQCYHIGLYLQNTTCQSVPLSEGGVQAFECYIIPSQTRVYITVEREGGMLVYDCYRDEEV